jgi:hypothetical protein
VKRSIAAKAVIALVAFPILVHLIFTVVSKLAALVLPDVLVMAGSWSELLSKGVIVAAFLIAVRGSFSVCRRLWPAETVAAK